MKTQGRKGINSYRYAPAQLTKSDTTNLTALSSLSLSLGLGFGSRSSREKRLQKPSQAKPSSRHVVAWHADGDADAVQSAGVGLGNGWLMLWISGVECRKLSVCGCTPVAVAATGRGGQPPRFPWVPGLQLQPLQQQRQQQPLPPTPRPHAGAGRGRVSCVQHRLHNDGGGHPGLQDKEQTAYAMPSTPTVGVVVTSLQWCGVWIRECHIGWI